MRNALAIVESASNGALLTLNDKGKTGTFARAIAFASRDTRIQLGQMMHLRWLQNGQYRPLVDDILSCGLVPKTAVPFVAGLVPTNGPVRKENLMALCTAVAGYCAGLRNKDGTSKEFKGEKLFVLELVRRIADDAEGTVLEVAAE